MIFIILIIKDFYKTLLNFFYWVFSSIAFFTLELVLSNTDNLFLVSDSLENGWLYVLSSQEEFNSLISGHPI